MARKESSSSPRSSPLSKLEEQLTCSVCLDLYTNPKTLPCLHSFCQDCLEGLSLDHQKISDAYYISCPSCRLRIDLTDGVGVLPAAFHINNLMETYNQMKEKKDAPPNVSDEQTQPPADTPCTTHGKSLDTYCETCDMLVCFTCVKQRHREHEYDLINDGYRKQCQILYSCLNPVKEKTVAITEAIAVLTRREEEIKQQSETVKEDIQAMMDEVISALRQSERQLIEEVDAVVAGKLSVLSQQKQSAQNSLSVLNEVQDYVEQSLKTEPPTQILSCKKEMMERMSHATAEVNVEELDPIEKADVKLIKDNKILEARNYIGDTHVTFTTLKQSKVSNISPVKYLQQENKVSFSLSLEAPDSSPLCVPLSSFQCSLVKADKVEKTDATVKSSSTHPGMYELQCSPLSNGHHNLKVTACGVGLEPASIVIPFSPYLTSMSPVYTISGLDHPWAVAVTHDGSIMVTDNWVHTVMSFGTSQKVLGGEFGSGNIKFSYPRGIAVTQDDFILVTDNDKVQKMNKDGHRIASVGKEGSGARRFSYPAGIAISPVSKLIYIADRSNHRIQVMNPDLSFSHTFGSKGGNDGQFQYPTHIAIDSQGSIYVTDRGNHRIQKFSVDEKFLVSSGADSPSGIAVDNDDLVYVANDGTQSLSVFNREGEFIRSFTLKGVNPKGIAFDKKGTFYVCNDKEILVYGM